MAELNFSADDLRASVASGTISEAQAASIITLSQSRAGRRATMGAQDKPFEFFRGFAEIFIAVGLVILLSGVLMLLVYFGVASNALTVVPLVMAGIVWWMAEYFTRKRRMVLPSMILAMSFGIAVGIVVLSLFIDKASPNPRSGFVLTCLSSMLAMGVWYWRFRLPVTMFFFGLAGLGVFYTMTLSTPTLVNLGLTGDLRGALDLRASPEFALATLLFGLAAFAGAMWFDTRDPHRLGRHAATGFWLHLLAAPALVNTIAMTLYNLGGTTGMLATTLGMLGISVMALVIDRRSFLTAGIIYIALLISWAIDSDGNGSFGKMVAMMLILGAFVTALGTWWVQMRAWLMCRLPNFPGKSKLPPYMNPSAEMSTE